LSSLALSFFEFGKRERILANAVFRRLTLSSYGIF
jgi:hypothetical protein